MATFVFLADQYFNHIAQSGEAPSADDFLCALLNGVVQADILT